MQIAKGMQQRWYMAVAVSMATESLPAMSDMSALWHLAKPDASASYNCGAEFSRDPC